MRRQSGEEIGKPSKQHEMTRWGNREAGQIGKAGTRTEPPRYRNRETSQDIETIKTLQSKNRRPRNRGNQAAEANRTARGNRDRIAGEPNSNSERAAARERHDMIGSKQIGIPPAAANRQQPAHPSPGGGGQIQAGKPRRAGERGSGGKEEREPSHPLTSALSHEMDDIDHLTVHITQSAIPPRQASTPAGRPS